jgi:hypothetical protein
MKISLSCRRVATVLVLFLASFILAGCSTTPTTGEVMEKELKGAPDWVSKGCNLYWKPDVAKKMICGIGSVSGTSNPTLAREVAVGRARADIARKMQVSVNAMLKDYQATTAGSQNFGSAGVDEQHIESVVKQVTDVNLQGSELVETWISEAGTFYALVALDARKFKENVGNMGTLSESLRKAIVERSDKSFEQLDREIEKGK